jgi:hypothetical protein
MPPPTATPARFAAEDAHAVADVAVRPELQQHGSQNDRAAGGSLDVRVRQPGVEREHRHLDQERQCKARKAKPGCRPRKREAAERQVIERRIAGRFGVSPHQVQDGSQHHHAADHREDEKLVRCLDALDAAPDADEKQHRNQHQLPEYEEQEQIERDESAEHCALQDEKRETQILGAMLDGAERDVRCDGRGERGEQHHPQADAVDRDVVTDAESGDPVGDELEMPALVHRRGEQADGCEKIEAEHGQRERAQKVRRLARQEQQRHGAEQRQPHDERQNVRPFLARRERSFARFGPQPAQHGNAERRDDADRDPLEPVRPARHEHADRERREIGCALEKRLREGAQGSPAGGWGCTGLT